MTEILLIRHGETQWNREGRFQGHTDVPLNANGQRQAQAVAEALRGAPLDAIYSSDLARAHQTALTVAAATGAPLTTDRRLREIHLGHWEGLTFDEIRTRDGDALDHFLHDPVGARSPEGESVPDVRSRVLAALDDILRGHPTGRVAIISHGLALAVLKVELLGLPLASVWQHEPHNALVETYRREET